MADVKTLKEKLVDHLIDQLENPGEDGVPGFVLSTAAKVVKDFQHETEDKDAELAIKDKKLAAFLGRKGVQGTA
jgi:hypothetical protein